MLIDVIQKRKVDAAKEEQSEIIAMVNRKLHPRTVQRIIQTIDEAIERTVQSCGRFVWTKTGALVGRTSKETTKDINHLWDNVIEIAGEGRLTLIAVGCLIRWRIALRPETWCLYRRESDKRDPLTGNTIFVSEYWIDEDYELKERNLVRSRVQDLAQAWGARVTT